MGLFSQSDKYGPSHTEPKHLQKLREIADRAAEKAAKEVKEAAKKGK